jgi:hypothetical protein
LDLPGETLLAILVLLPRYNLRNIRLVCKKLRPYGDELFIKKYVVDCPDAVKKLVEISKDKYFCGKVRDIDIYNCQLSTLHCVSSYLNQVRDHNLSGHEWLQSPNFEDRYEDSQKEKEDFIVICQEQKQRMESGQDGHSIKMAICRMPNIKHISYSFGHWSKRRNKPEWYWEKCQELDTTLMLQRQGTAGKPAFQIRAFESIMDGIDVYSRLTPSLNIWTWSSKLHSLGIERIDLSESWARDYIFSILGGGKFIVFNFKTGLIDVGE